MDLSPNKIALPERGRWTSTIKIVLLVILIVTIFLIARGMVQHRFFRGGWVNSHDVLKP